MEKSLPFILLENQAARGESMFDSIKSAVLPIAKVFTMCFMGFLMASKNCWNGNIGNIPLVLIAALCRDEPNPFGDPYKCSESGNAYISFGQWVGAIILYTYVFQMLAPPKGETFDSDEDEKLPTKDPAAHERLPSKASLLKVEKISAKVSFKDDTPERVPLLPSEEFEMGPSPSRKVIAKILFVLEKLKQPPIIASALAIFCGTMPFLKSLILKDDAPLFSLTDSCLILGEAMIPCILLALGGNLVDGPGVGSKKLGFRTMAAIVFARLVLVPAVGLGIITLVDKIGFIPKGDKMFKFVLLLQHSMPTSVLSGAVANLQGCGKEAAAVLFWRVSAWGNEQ